MAVNKKIPMRKCVGCGEMKPKKELLRILRTETGEFVVDALGKANGRGSNNLQPTRKRGYRSFIRKCCLTIRYHGKSGIGVTCTRRGVNLEMRIGHP